MRTTIQSGLLCREWGRIAQISKDDKLKMFVLYLPYDIHLLICTIIKSL